MSAENDRAELERRLAQVRRLLTAASDPTTTDRLSRLADEIDDQLRKSKQSCEL